MSVLRKIQRVGKRATKFQYTATYQSVVVESLRDKWWVAIVWPSYMDMYIWTWTIGSCRATANHSQWLSSQAGKVLSITSSRYRPIDQSVYASWQFAHCHQELNFTLSMCVNVNSNCPHSQTQLSFLSLLVWRICYMYIHVHALDKITISVVLVFSGSGGTHLLKSPLVHSKYVRLNRLYTISRLYLLYWHLWLGILIPLTSVLGVHLSKL